MGHPPRLDYRGARHHVMNRGARRAPIFVDDESCLLFLGLLADLPERFDVRVHGYALMPNHFHLQVETPRGNLSQAMRHLEAAYTTRLNRLHTWDGPLFRGRFRNRVVEDELYWQYLLVYLHLNPIRAHLTKGLDDEAWTSHAAYMGAQRAPDWLTTADLLDVLGGRDGYRRYLEDVRLGRVGPPPGFDPDDLWMAAPTLSVPRPERPLLPPEEAIAQVCRVTGATTADLVKSGVGRNGNPARWVAAWWLTQAAGLTQPKAAAYLGASLAIVSRWLGKVRRARVAPGPIREWVESLERVES